MALIWEEINGLLVTSAAANFPSGAPPRDRCQQLLVARTKPVPVTFCAFRGRVWRDKNKKVHLCLPRKAASMQTKVFEA